MIVRGIITVADLRRHRGDALRFVVGQRDKDLNARGVCGVCHDGEGEKEADVHGLGGERFAGAQRARLGSPKSMNFMPWKKIEGGYQPASGFNSASRSFWW